MDRRSNADMGGANLMIEQTRVIEVQRWWHGEFAVLVPAGLLHSVIGIARSYMGEADGLWLAALGASSLALASRISAIIVDKGAGGILVLHRHWGTWLALHADWQHVDVHDARLGFYRHGQVGLPAMRGPVVGRGYFGVARLHTPGGTTTYVRVRRPKVLRRLQLQRKANVVVTTAT